MDTPQPQYYPRGEDFALPDVRDALNRRRDSDPDLARLSQETVHSEYEVLAVVEAPLVEDRGVCG